MSDFGVFLHYWALMRKRAFKALVKNLFLGLCIVCAVSFLMIFQLWKIISLNLDQIHLYRFSILSAISLTLFLFSLFRKKTPLECHPADMIHLSGGKLQKIIIYKLFKKAAAGLFFSFLTAFLLMKFELNTRTFILQILIWNLLLSSLALRHIAYHGKKSLKLYLLLLLHYCFLNTAVYLPDCGSLLLLSAASCLSLYAVRHALNTALDFHKLFAELSRINRANYLARGNRPDEAREFVREVSAQKHRQSLLLRLIRSKNPLIQKNIISFSRISLFVPIYISLILASVILLYQFEIFGFVRALKASGFALEIVALHQALFIINIIELIANQKHLLISKSKEGLYLPYSKIETANSFFVLGLPILLLEVPIVGVIFKKSAVLISLSLFLYAAVFYICLLFEKKKKEDLFRAASFLAILAISYYFLRL